MGRKGIILYESWGTMISELPTEQAGKLIQAICVYSFGGVDPNIDDQNVKAMFAMIRVKIDEDFAKYDEKVARAREAQLKRRNHGGDLFNIEKDHINNEKDLINSENDLINGISKTISISINNTKESKERKTKTPTPTEAIDASSLSDSVKEKLKEWVAYKTERREAYKPVGLKALITAVGHHEQAEGAEAVINLIGECMANGWKGIIWDRLGQLKQKQPEKLTQMHNYQQRQYDFTELEKQLVRNA